MPLVGLILVSGSGISSYEYALYGGGYYKVTITTYDVARTFSISVAAEVSTIYFSVPSSALIELKQPVMYSTIRVQDRIAWYPEEGSLDAPRGAQNIYVKLYNSKSRYLDGASITNLVVEGGGGRNLY